ncbi:MAG: hypothetical protein KJ607_09225 [Bacteroidetes bacterium]|nr:hypothetical protein [Bacteroidota bacterium]
MTNLLLYNLAVSVCLALFYLAYRFFLSGETHFRLNRLYLAGVIVLSFVVPVSKISYIPGDSVLDRFIVA